MSVNTTAGGEQLTVDEQVLLRVWGAVFGVRVDLDDDFFDLGGDSLFGLEIIHRISDELQINIDLSLLYRESTVRALATALRQVDLTLPHR